MLRAPPSSWCQSCDSYTPVPAVCVALFLFLAHRAGPEVVDIVFASLCMGLPTGHSHLQDVESGAHSWGHCWVCFPVYLSCCRFLDDNQIVTSSGDTTW